MVRMALLGCGRIGAMHAENIARHSRAELTAVYDVAREAAHSVAEASGARVVSEVQEIFDSKSIDAVLVASATNTHAEFIEQAVASGKPVLCEKPIDLSLERVNRCGEAIKGSMVPVQIGFNRRFDPGHRAARQAVATGEIGALHQVVITSRDPALPSRAYLEVAGGFLRDMTIHDFDLARYMLMEEPTEVFAVGGALIDRTLGEELDEIDTAMLILRTASGRQCHINNSRTAVYGYDQRVELLGEKGMLISGNRKPHELRRYGAECTEAASNYLYFFAERYEEAFLAELDGFIDCVENGTTPLAGFEDGRRSLILAEAAYKALAEQRLVKVDEIA